MVRSHAVVSQDRDLPRAGFHMLRFLLQGMFEVEIADSRQERFLEGVRRLIEKAEIDLVAARIAIPLMRTMWSVLSFIARRDRYERSRSGMF